VGGALGLVAACDLSIAAADVRFGFGEVRLGLAPTTAAVHCLPKMRRADALELLLTGERFGAQRAAEAGIINRVVAPESLDDSVAGLVAALILGGPIALGACKRLARTITDAGPDAYALARELNAALVGSPEATEGIAAFLDRRPPVWART
ncbi:MAG TPA: enoyl-CoA hydratase-related protein, partial [Ilumatobacteraceae bacterium]|nr:enoyl-CoA hydratase-related protein [Ilumatobacteraceae bacterium]